MSTKAPIMLASAALMLTLTTGCVEKGPPAVKVDKAYVQANILREAPAILDNVVNADFDGKVIYLGNTVETKVLAPGGAGSIVHYWKVVEAPGSSWRVFSHLNGDHAEWMNLDATDMRAGYPPAKWQAGQIIRDEQKFTLAENWASQAATMTVGLYQKGGQGVSARMDIVNGPKDAERRAPAFRFTVTDGTPKADARPSYRIRKAMAPIVVDGIADEESWKNAPMSPNFSDAEGGRPVGKTTSARLLWDDNYLYAFVQMADDDVYSQFTERDDTLWKEDVIEFFIDADRNKRGYVELQINPNNAHFDAWFPQTRAQKHFFDWNSNMKSALVVHGTSDNRSDTDRGWDVEVAIPLADVKGMDAAMAITLPPALGDTWRMNIVRGEKPKDKGLAAASWNPITNNDFHALDRMLDVVFADALGEIDESAVTVEKTSSEKASGEKASGESETSAPSAEGTQPEKVEPPVSLRGQQRRQRDLKRAIKDGTNAPPKSADEIKRSRSGRPE